MAGGRRGDTGCIVFQGEMDGWVGMWLVVADVTMRGYARFGRNWETLRSWKKSEIER
jgi:hypothetical protein